MISNVLGTPCPECGRPLEPSQRLHLDHIVPSSLGGPDHPSNLQVLHARCNLLKSDKPPRGQELALTRTSREW